VIETRNIRALLDRARMKHHEVSSPEYLKSLRHTIGVQKIDAA